MEKKIMTAIAKWIEDNMATKITLNDLVSYSGYSSRYINSLFHTYVHMSPGRYILNRRLSRTAVRLRLSSQSITEIAHQLCFDSIQSFSREFKKLFGVSPSYYRRREEWDLSGIKAPFCFKDIIVPSLELVQLSQLQLLGYDFSYNRIIGRENLKCKQLRLDTVIRGFNKYKKDIYLVSDVCQDMTHDNKIAVQVFSGFVFESKKNIGEMKKLSLSPGLYACFTFSEKWKNYSKVFEKIYLEVLPSYGLKRARGVDIERFHFKEMTLSPDEHVFDIKYYIPVTS